MTVLPGPSAPPNLCLSTALRTEGEVTKLTLSDRAKLRFTQGGLTPLLLRPDLHKWLEQE